MSKMPHPEKVEVRRGHVPDTLSGVDDTFCFVNLDMDLYYPTLEALKFFYPRMAENGVILLHDYYSTLLGVKKAVYDFENSIGASLPKIPAGDHLSIAIIKT